MRRMAVCYRHTNRETGVSCSSCGKPICPDCMTPTSVGMRCPECARERTKVKRIGTMPETPVVTQALIAINVAVFIAEIATGTTLAGGGGGKLIVHGAAFGPAIHQQHEYWRLLTAGFLHLSLIHILFNMMFLYFMGPMLEPPIGRVNFAVVYFTSLLAGSFGALLFQPEALTVGASGACFGILGALLVVAHDRRISIWQSGLGLTLVLNLGFTLSVSGISIGGHLGGVVGGLISGALIVYLGERRRMRTAAIAGCVVVAALCVVGAIAVSGSTGLTPSGV